MKKDVVSFPDFQKLDLRIGKILHAEIVEGSTSLIRLEVDLGEDYGKVKILAGIGKWYTVDKLKSKKFIFVANLAPRKMMKEESQGMMLAADVNGKAVLVPVEENIATGSVVR